MLVFVMEMECEWYVEVMNGMVCVVSVMCDLFVLGKLCEY